ncbi:MAG: transglutaminase family protein [Phycisphaerales bacterium]|nr:transglutaminase family protein [Phycisphaerales bacterium]
MSRHPFDLLMELDTPDIRLDCAALHLARDAFPDLNMTVPLRTLDDLAARVSDERPGLAANLRYEALRKVLVGDFGLTGNRDQYYDPDNCYLNQVLARRVGMPLSLSIVWIEVARRLKWPVAGVGLPGHFVVRIDDPERLVIVDPFNDGRTLGLDECRRIVRQRFGRSVRFSRSLLAPVDARGILARLLRNLRNVYLAANELPRVACVIQRMAALEPGNGQHLQDMAAICCRLGDLRRAYAHLAAYLHRMPGGQDSGQVLGNLRQLRAALVALN